MRRHVVVPLVAVISATFLVVVAQVTSGAPKAAGVNDAAIKKVITAGITASQTAPIPPQERRGKKLDAGTVAELKKNGRAKLASYYSGGGLADRAKALDAAIAEEEPGSVVFLASGVDNIVINNIVVSGDTATATGTADVWLDVAQVQPDGSLIVAHPRNSMVLTFGLAWESGAWMITAQNAAFAPGSEP